MAEEIRAAQSQEREPISDPIMEKGNELGSSAEPEYPSMRRVIPIVAALYVSIFLVALV